MPGSDKFNFIFFPCFASIFLCGTVRAGPADEPWLSERVADAASATLSAILKGAPDMEKLVAPDCRAGGLRPDRMTLAFQADGVTQLTAPEEVLRALPSARGPVGVQAAWRALASKVGKDPHFKIKIIDTDLRAAPEVRTRLLFTLTGTAPGSGRVEHQAEWIAGWRLEGPRDEPRPVLASLEAVACHESRSSTAAPWLSDCTQSLLGGLPWFEGQFAHGNPWWRARLQKSFDHFLYGHRGLAIGDANGDGLDDVYLCEEGGLPNRLLLQQPDGTVRDASAESGTDILDLTRAALFLDLDADGDEDLALSTSHGLLMLENLGAARFRQRTLLPRVGDGYSMAATDCDGNGYPDIYVCTYQAKDADAKRLPFPAPFYDARNGGENFLVGNDGNWRFTNATALTGLDKGNDRFSFAAMWTDVNDDGLPDLAVVNDFGKNNLYRQSRDAQGRVHFTDVTDTTGLENGAFGMAVTGADADRNGSIDLYTSNMFSSAGHRITAQPGFKPGIAPDLAEKFRHLARGNSLFLNDAGHFRDVSQPAGVAMGRWSWGSHFADLNNDGWEDLLVGNGNITGHLTKPDL
jgi:hypothetical protein